MRIPTAVRRCSAPHYGLLANSFFPPRNALVFPGTTGLPDRTPPCAPFRRLREPPPPEGETVRTAGRCGRAGGAATPALSPAILPVGLFQPPNFSKQGYYAGFGGPSPVGVSSQPGSFAGHTVSYRGRLSAVFTTDYTHSHSRTQSVHCVLDNTSSVTWQACRTDPAQRRMKRAAPHGTAPLFLSFYSSFCVSSCAWSLCSCANRSPRL